MRCPSLDHSQTGCALVAWGASRGSNIASNWNSVLVIIARRLFGLGFGSGAGCPLHDSLNGPLVLPAGNGRSTVVAAKGGITLIRHLRGRGVEPFSPHPIFPDH